jgi:hypothetical protein
VLTGYLTMHQIYISSQQGFLTGTPEAGPSGFPGFPGVSLTPTPLGASLRS